MPDGDRVAEGHTFQNGGIFRLFPEWFKADGQRRHCNAQRIVLDVVVGIGAKPVHGDRVLFIEILGEVPDEGFSLHQRGVRNGQKHLRQCDRRLRSILCRHNGVRQKVGIDIGVLAVMLHLGEIFSVFDDHARVLTASLVVDHFEVVPFKFTAPQIQKRTRCTTQAGADALRSGYRERLCHRVFGLAGEVMWCGGVLEHTLHSQRRGDGFRFPLQGGDIGKVI